MAATIGVIANPVSGRDIRRLAARGGVTTSQDKRNRIARAVVGAVTAGAERVLVMDEPFAIASGAIADLDLDAELTVVDVGARVAPEDTERAAIAMRDAGVDVLITLGGDGTNRTIAGVWSDAVLVPMSTGTNNVFPSQVEPTIAGAAAGLVAAGIVPLDAAAPVSKVVRVELPSGERDLALIDAVVLADDFVGNKMPVEPACLRQLVLTIAKPDTIGVSSIGGLSAPLAGHEDAGLIVTCGGSAATVTAPVAPGLYREVPVQSADRVTLGERIEVHGDVVLAFDGDRERRVRAGEVATLTVERNGPRVVDIAEALRLGSAEGAFHR